MHWRFRFQRCCPARNALRYRSRSPTTERTGDRHARAVAGVRVGRTTVEAAADRGDRRHDVGRFDGQAVAHAGAVGEAGDVDPVGVDAPGLHQLGDQRLQEADVVGAGAALQRVPAAVPGVRVRDEEPVGVGRGVERGGAAQFLGAARAPVQGDHQRDRSARAVPLRGVQQRPPFVARVVEVDLVVAGGRLDRGPGRAAGRGGDGAGRVGVGGGRAGRGTGRGESEDRGCQHGRPAGAGRSRTAVAHHADYVRTGPSAPPGISPARCARRHTRKVPRGTLLGAPSRGVTACGGPRLGRGRGHAAPRG